MAEGVGFEPTGRLHAQRFSRPPLSAAQPSLRELIILNIFISNVNRYQRTRLLPQVSPPPNAVRSTSEPFFMEPSRTASSSAMGTVAEEILPYFCYCHIDLFQGDR